MATPKTGNQGDGEPSLSSNDITMKKHILILLSLGLFTAGLSSGLAKTIIERDFEAGSSSTGPEPKFLEYGDTFVGVATKEDYDFAPGASDGSEAALVLTGGQDEPHSWQPAVDFDLPSMKGGYLKVSFKFRVASLDVGDCVFQIWGVGDDGDKEMTYQYLWFNPLNVRATGTGQHMFKSGMTSGSSSEWHSLVWTIPMPGTTDTVTLEIDGKEYGNFKQPPGGDVTELVKLRFFLQNNKTEDNMFAIDDLVVEHIKDK